MDLRDHLFAKAAYLIGGPGGGSRSASVEIKPNGRGHGVPESGFDG